MTSTHIILQSSYITPNQNPLTSCHTFPYLVPYYPTRIHKDDARLMLLGIPKHLSNDSGRFSNIFVHNCRCNHLVRTRCWKKWPYNSQNQSNYVNGWWIYLINYLIFPWFAIKLGHVCHGFLRWTFLTFHSSILHFPHFFGATLMKDAVMLCAMALANSVFPVPGGP